MSVSHIINHTYFKDIVSVTSGFFVFMNKMFNLWNHLPFNFKAYN